MKDKAFFFVALEGVRENLQRPNLSEPIGTPCPVSDADARRQRGAHQQQRRLPAARAAQLLPDAAAARTKDCRSSTRSTTTRCSAKSTGSLTPTNNLSASYNFDYSKNPNQTSTSPTYGTSANGTEGPSKINVLNLNLFSRSPRTS